MKRIGLMGCGTVAGYGHLPAIQEVTDLELHALYDPNEKNLRATQQQFNVPHAFTDVNAFFESGIDAVSITSPASFHWRNVADAAAHGKDILCEKPLAPTEEDCSRIVTLAETAGVMLFTGFNYRFSTVAQKVKQLLNEQAVGKVRSLRLVYIWHCHGKMEKDADGRLIENFRREQHMAEGGPMLGCGVHQIDLARWWLGSEVVNWTTAAAWVDEHDAPDHHYLHMDHENGAHTMVEMSYSYCHTAAEPIWHFTYELIGTEGLIRYDREAEIFEVRNTKGTQQLPFGGAKDFAGMYAAFARALETGEPGDLATGQDGLIVSRLACEASETAVKNRSRAQGR